MSNLTPTIISNNLSRLGVIETEPASLPTLFPQTGAIAPRVSVAMITYNHEAYLSRAIEGVLQQQTDFPFELVIGEDCSTDGTRAICRDFAAKYPDKIVLRLREKNVGMLENFRQVYDCCRGEFIAICEGDDYWTSPRKLQRQVAAMETNPQWSASFHRVIVTDTHHQEPDILQPANDTAGEVTLDMIAAENGIPTCSFLIRRTTLPRLPEWYPSLGKIGDWPLFILAASRGPIGYLPDVMAVHLRHSAGVWTSLHVIDQLDHILHALTYLEIQCEEPLRSVVATGRRKYLANFLQSHGGELERLRKIERRYRALQLHKLAAIGKWFKDCWRPSGQ